MKTTRRKFAIAAGTAVAAAVLPLPAAAEDALQPFAQFLSKDELERIHKDFAESAPFLEKFRAVKLANVDEPDFTFSGLAKR